MRAPAFWWQDSPGPLARLLSPLGFVYGRVAAGRLGRAGARAAMPVVCVGNFTAGGAGKTPAALAIAGLLIAAGRHPAFLTRGYGGRMAGPVRVEPGHDAGEVGDEPLLLARCAPTIVSRDRPAGADMARAIGADVLVMDDGLQNPSLVKDLAIAVVDGRTGLGNGLPLPAGPLRAPLEAQWPAIDAVLVVGEGAAGARVAKAAGERGKPVFRATVKPEDGPAAGLRGARVLAFAGIARPEKLFDTLRDCGAIVAATRSFPDHHPFAAADLAELRDAAGRQGLSLVTTEKDLARIGPAAAGGDIRALPVRLHVDAPSRWRDFILAGVLARDAGALPGRGP
ncbi:MAG: tetraacyldisaccharide 4'-kinase [Microvirga sp.]